MPKRMFDQVETRVRDAIGALPILDAAREQIEWEVTPVLVPVTRTEFAFSFMVAVCVPVSGQAGDYVLFSGPLNDPHAPQQEVTALVAGLYEQCLAQADAIRRKTAQLANGHRKPLGGLIIP